MQKIEETWKQISLKNMPVVYPNHFNQENINKAKDHFHDIKDNLI